MIYSILMSLIGFVLFSVFLVLIKQLIEKLSSRLLQFPLFWHGLLLLSFIPLLPVSYRLSESIIPSILLTDFVHSNTVLKSSKIIISRVYNHDIGQYSFIILLMIIGIGCVVSITRFIQSWFALNKFSCKCEKVSKSK